MEFKWPLRIYIEDTDSGGIVYYVNYLKFMERARTEYLRELGYGKAAINDRGEMIVVHSANVRYHQSARLDDEVCVTAKLEKVAKAFVIFSQRVIRDDSVLCESEIKLAWVKEGKPFPIPQSMRETLLKQMDDSECE